MVMSTRIKPVFFPALLLCFLSSFSLFAQSDPADQAAELVGNLRDSMYLQDIDDDALYRQYRITLADLGELNINEREMMFWESQSAYYLARGYQALDTVDEVLAQDEDLRKGKFKRLQKSYSKLDDIIALYEDSMALAGEYLSGGRDARGVRLYAESLSQLSTLKTLGFLMANGTKITPLAEEAVELDPDEVKAHMLLASRYVYSPGIWGGNPDKGIAMLEDIAAMDGLDREDEHNIAVGIGFAHTMADRWDEAVPYFRRALDVYPGNIYAAAMLRLSESGGS
jgi:tetratricopeptide (TPR) repeat protein